MKKILIGTLLTMLVLTVACKEEAVEEAVPVEEVTPAVEEVIEEVVE